MPAAGCEEDGGTNQRPTWIQEQNAQLQISQADVGHLSVSFIHILINIKILVITEKCAVMRCPGSQTTSH